MESRSILEISGVEQNFASGFWMKPKKVLHGISLSVPERSIFGFLGANGAGKTTLIHLIVGLRRPKAGTLKVGGFECHTPEARSRVGYLPERPYFHEHLTGQEFLLYLGTLSGMKRSLILDRIPQVLATVGMKEARHKELRAFSKGMLQRIGIAQAILHDPEFLVFDEPMSGLDPVGRKEIRELIVELAAQGKTVFFCTHVIPDAESICDQVAIIRNGKLLGAGPLATFLSQGVSRFELAFAGPDEDRIRREAILSGFRQIPEGWRGVLENEIAAHEALQSVLRMNGRVLWMNPVRPSLETIFQKGADEDVLAR